jgi:hypothetical protein
MLVCPRVRSARSEKERGEQEEEEVGEGRRRRRRRGDGEIRAERVDARGARIARDSAGRPG